MPDMLEFPSVYDRLEEQWVDFLQVSFSGLDYWRLSKEWKLKVFKQVAKMMMDDIRHIEEIRHKHES